MSKGLGIAFIEPFYLHFCVVISKEFLHSVVSFQVFLSNTNDSMVSSNYFYQVIIICLHTVI